MGATLQEIREGLATNLRTLSDSPNNVQVSPYILDNPTPPSLYVMGPEETIYDLAMQRGLDEWQIIVQGFVGGVTDIGAQIRLDEWLAPSGGNSVKTALEKDKTLGGKVCNIRVVSSSGYRLYHVESQVTTLGADWTCRIYNTGS
jgi:hypothetical protein